MRVAGSLNRTRFPCVIILSMSLSLVAGCAILNMPIHATDPKRKAMSEVHSVADALDAVEPSLGLGDLYARSFVSADVTTELLPRLKFEHFLRLDVSVGHALKLVDGSAEEEVAAHDGNAGDDSYSNGSAHAAPSHAASVIAATASVEWWWQCR